MLTTLGEITGENSLEEYQKSLTDQCLSDLKLIETILEETKKASGDMQKYTQTDALIASYLIPLSLERETAVAEYINLSLTLTPYLRHFKTVHLKEYPLFLDNEKLHDEKTNKWAKYLRTVMILGVVTMIILPRITKRKN